MVPAPDDEDYTYVEYDGDIVPYYRGYYYIGGVWVWRGRGKPPFPPPKFRPGNPGARVAAPRPAARTAAPVKSAPVKRTPVKAPKSTHRPGRAPRGPHP